MSSWIEYFQTLFASNQFFQGGIVLALISWSAYQLKAFPIYCWRKVVYLVTYETYFDEKSAFYDCFSQWMNENYPGKFRRTEVKIVSGDWAEHGHAAQAPAASVNRPKYYLRFFQFTDSNFVWYRRRLLFVSKQREKLEQANDFSRMHLNSYAIRGMFARRAIEHLCNEILSIRYQREEIKGVEVRYNNGGYFVNRVLTITKSFEHLFFGGKQSLLRDLDQFSSSRERYLSKGINYKRGYLFYGPPGTGKTSVAIAIAGHLKRSLFVINLASVVSDRQLQELALEVSGGSIILFEDIDCIIDKRNVSGNSDLNFSTILNVLDGLYSPSDCVFILTTNHPESIDSAILRKGRIDFSLEIGHPTQRDVEAFLSSYYDTPVSLPKHRDLPMSEIQDVCLRNPIAELAVEEIVREQVSAATV